MPPASFLFASPVVDYDHAAVATLATSLSDFTPAATAKRCFDWVRDEIQHSLDYHRNVVACAASDVLAAGTGLCLAKSHLLVALLRAHAIPAGFCYQRLLFDERDSLFCTHGLVALWLQDYGWYRCDARGNRPGIWCEFTPGRENLAFSEHRSGEHLYPYVWAEPWPELVRRLRALESIAQYCADPIDLTPPACADDQVIRMA
jgi:hypothetical protein